MIKNILIAITACTLISVIGLMLLDMIGQTPAAKKTLGVKAFDGYEAATKSAIKAWNDWVGCKFLVPGEDIIIRSEAGEPCGDLWRPEEEWGHAATSYRCGSHAEIWISRPGTNHTQAHAIGHEIGHILEREHQTKDIMGRPPDPNGGNKVLRISDVDKKPVHARFCE